MIRCWKCKRMVVVAEPQPAPGTGRSESHLMCNCGERYLLVVVQIGRAQPKPVNEVSEFEVEKARLWRNEDPSDAHSRMQSQPTGS